MTNYDFISTTDLLNRYNGLAWDDTLVVYLDVPHQIDTITQDKRDVIVSTDRDTFVIPRGDKPILMWRVLA